MRCSDYEILISAYADGELNGKDLVDVESHISRCSSCKRLYEQMVDLQRDMAHVLADCKDVPDLVSTVAARVRPKPRFNWTWAAAAALVPLAACIYAFLRPAATTPRVYVTLPDRKFVVQKEPAVKTAPELPDIKVPYKEQAASVQIKHHTMRSSQKDIAKKMPSVVNKEIANPVSSPDVEDKADVVVTYTDASPVAGTSADISVQPQAIYPGQRVVADTETVNANGKSIRRLCYRIVDTNEVQSSNEENQESSR